MTTVVFHFAITSLNLTSPIDTSCVLVDIFAARVVFDMILINSISIDTELVTAIVNGVLIFGRLSVSLSVSVTHVMSLS